MKKFIFVTLTAVSVVILFSCSSVTGTPDIIEGPYTTSICIEAGTDASAAVDGLEDGLCSFTEGGQDASSEEGDDYSMTPAVYINNGSFDAEKSATDENVSGRLMTDTSVTVRKTGGNGLMVSNSAYAVEHSEIIVSTPEADGSDTCDFTGKGSALAVYGESDVTVCDSILGADGVACLSVFTDNGASVFLNRVSLSSTGGTLYSGYVNSPDQSEMAAPPWILGIMGNSRCTNLMGNGSTMTVADSDAAASNWAVLSMDSGSGMVLNVVNTEMTLTGSDTPVDADGKFDGENPYTSRSGYGSYVLGDSSETFLGVTINVGTYAAILTGGSVYYGNLEAGRSYDMLKADGSVHTTYTAQEDKKTVINSDTFGFMAHQGTNECVIDGAEVNSGYTGFLVKSGNDTTITIENGAEINAGNGILLQLMDNDDSTTEFDSETMAFGEKHEEYAGFPETAVTYTEGFNEDDADDEIAGMTGAADEDNSANGSTTINTAVYNVRDTNLTGSIYNGIGWVSNDLSAGNVVPMVLEVNLSGSSVLTGAVASVSCIHVTYEGQEYLKSQGITAFDDEKAASEFADKYQTTCFSQSEYYNIGQVANLVRVSGLNTIDVTLSDSAVWNVNGTSLVDSVVISGSAEIVIEKGCVLTVGSAVYEEGTYTASDFN